MPFGLRYAGAYLRQAEVYRHVQARRPYWTRSAPCAARAERRAARRAQRAGEYMLLAAASTIPDDATKPWPHPKDRRASTRDARLRYPSASQPRARARAARCGRTWLARPYHGGSRESPTFLDLAGLPKVAADIRVEVATGGRPQRLEWATAPAIFSITDLALSIFMPNFSEVGCSLIMTTSFLATEFYTRSGVSLARGLGWSR